MGVQRKPRRAGGRNLEDRISRIERDVVSHIVSGGHKRIDGLHQDIRVSATERLYAIYTNKNRESIVYKRRRVYDPAASSHIILEIEEFYENGQLKEKYISENYVYDPPIAAPVEWEVTRMK